MFKGVIKLQSGTTKIKEIKLKFQDQQVVSQDKNPATGTWKIIDFQTGQVIYAIIIMINKRRVRLGNNIYYIYMPELSKNNKEKNNFN